MATWEYLKFLSAAKEAAESAISNYNSVRNPYRDQSTLLLLSNAWELLAKAALLKRKTSIKAKQGLSIAGEEAVHKLFVKKVIDENQCGTIQQIISLRNACAHGVLPSVPQEILHHLLYFGTKFFRDLIEKEFSSHAKDLTGSYLCLAFDELTTYADKVQKAISKVRSSKADNELIWLLERGIAFDGTGPLTKPSFEKKYQGKKKITPHLELAKYMASADMVRIVPLLAPKNYTANVELRKGSASQKGLPVITTKTDVETDYPYLTAEMAQKVNRDSNWVAQSVRKLGLFGDSKFHQSIKSSKSSSIQRYSEACLARLKETLAKEPDYWPY